MSNSLILCSILRHGGDCGTCAPAADAAAELPLLLLMRCLSAHMTQAAPPMLAARTSLPRVAACQVAAVYARKAVLNRVGIGHFLREACVMQRVHVTTGDAAVARA